MTESEFSKSQPLLLLVAGAKGAVGSTLAVAATAMRSQPEGVLPSLTTGQMFTYLGHSQAVYMAGWDRTEVPLRKAIEAQGAISENIWQPHADELDQVHVKMAPPTGLDLQGQVEKLKLDIQEFRDNYPYAQAVFINLLPACVPGDLTHCRSLSPLYSEADPEGCPDDSRSGGLGNR